MQQKSTTETTGVVSAIEDAVTMLKQHRETIQQAVGANTGTSTRQPGEPFDPDAVRRIAGATGLSPADAQVVAALWPVYELGTKEANKSR